MPAYGQATQTPRLGNDVRMDALRPPVAPGQHDQHLTGPSAQDQAGPSNRIHEQRSASSSLHTMVQAGTPEPSVLSTQTADLIYDEVKAQINARLRTHVLEDPHAQRIAREAAQEAVRQAIPEAVRQGIKDAAEEAAQPEGTFWSNNWFKMIVVLGLAANVAQWGALQFLIFGIDQRHNNAWTHEKYTWVAVWLPTALGLILFIAISWSIAQCAGWTSSKSHDLALQSP